MVERRKNRGTNARKSAVVPKIPSRIIAHAESEDYWGSRANESIKEFNEFASHFPDRYGWRFKTKDAFDQEVRNLMMSESKSLLDVNQLYWQDTLKNLEAYTVMSIWRTAELLKGAVSTLAAGDVICGAIVSRAVLESVCQFLDISRKVAPTLDSLPALGFQNQAIVSPELEELILKSVFASKIPDAGAEYNPTNILTVLKRISKIRDQDKFLERYGILCEVAHPNYLGRSVYVAEAKPGSRSGDETRILSRKHGKVSHGITSLTLWAISWSAATQVSSAILMQTSIGKVAQRISSPLH